MRRWFWLASLALLLGAGPLDEGLSAGQHAWDRGDYAGALVAWADALETARATGDASAEGDLLLRLAATYRKLGRYELASSALDLATKTSSEAGWQAQVSLGRGLIALDLGDSKAAEKTFQSAFRDFQKLGAPRKAADAAVDLGLARQARGDHEGAHKAFSAAVTLYTSLDDRSGQADALTNLGALERRDGALAQARTTLERAVEVQRAAGSVDGEADALVNLGGVLQDLGRDEEARTLYETALKNARTRKDVARQAAILQNLGGLEQRAHELSNAAAHYRAAEEAWRSVGRTAEARSAALDSARLSPNAIERLTALAEEAASGGDTRTETIARIELAALQAKSSPKSARKQLDRVRTLATKNALPGLSWRVDAAMGHLLLREGDAASAVEPLTSAITALELTRRALNDADARSFLQESETVYQDLVDALVATGDHAGAFLYAQRLQAAETGPTFSSNDPATKAALQLAREEAELAAALAEAQQSEAGAERAAALQQELDQVRVAFADTVDELRATHPEFQSAVRIAPEDLEAVQRELPPGTTVLQPVALDDRLVLLVFTHDTVTAKVLPVSGDELSRTVGRLARLLQAGAIQDPAWTTKLADTLGEWLLAPIEAELATTDVLAVAATGPFRQLPFGLLRHKGAYLVESTAVVGITHVGSLRERRATDARYHVSDASLLLIGNPDGTLPGAEEEVARIHKRFPLAVTMMGNSATRQALLAAAPGHSTIHLATHGMIDTQRPARSHLVLAGDEGNLGYREIPGLASVLDEARMVVLSACESGRPVQAKAAPEEEGEVVISINGLAAQFRRAGVETLVASLWRVDDNGTRELMDAFYGELAAGHDVARSMQRAQLTLLRREDLAHPWYWAGFQVVGDWR